MNINVRISTTQKGSAEQWLADFEQRMKGPTAVKVGFPAGKSDKDIVQIAVWNHFGTAGSQVNFVTKGIGGKSFGGFGGPIPPRPFITVAVFRHRSDLRRKLVELYRGVLAGKIDARVGLEKLAMYGVGIIDKTITGGVGPKNSPLTVAIKGSSKQLIASGRMTQSLTWAFDESAGRKFVPGRRRLKAGQRKAMR